jgi:NAD(P)-dependent dehydrogenase (short-subunit alcohol dehydrogenase family)
MSKRFGGRVVLVTGASRGIGAAAASRLAAEGADVAIVARTLDHHPTLPGSLTDTAGRIRSFGVRAAVVVADLTDPDDRARIVDEAVDALGPIDVLVNNAAASIGGSILDFPAKRVRLSMEANVVAPLELAQLVVPGMVERGEGWIVNLSSATANLHGGAPYDVTESSRMLAVYGASKAALNRITDGLAVQLHGTGVRVNAVQPRAAVLSEGAAAIAGARLRSDQVESMEAMVEGLIALCDCGPDHTGHVEDSLGIIQRLGLVVQHLDASGPFPGGNRPLAD